MLLNEALSTFRQLEDRREVARTLKEVGVLARERGQAERARLLLDESLGDLRELGDRREIARTLLELGVLMQQQGQVEEALRALLNAAVGLELVGAPDAYVVREMIEQARAHIDESAFTLLLNALPERCLSPPTHES